MIISEVPPIRSGISQVARRLKSGLEMYGDQVDLLSLSEIPRLALGEFRFSSMAWKAPHLLRPRLADYDIIHIHGPVPTFSDVALLFSALPVGRPGPVVFYTHHSEIDLHGLGLLCDIYNRLHKQLARLADQVIVTTPAYARNLRRYIPEDRIAIVPWGVAADWYSGQRPKAERFTVLFVGQMRPYKGLDILLDAIARLPDVELQIVGGGHQESRYRAMAADRHLDNVAFLGKLDDLALFDTFSAAHVLVLPSTTRAEAFGLVLLEGMVAGCVPVVSDLPGVTDVVGDAGLSFPVGDAAELAGALALLRDNIELRTQLSHRAQLRAHSYSWQRTIHWHRALYARVESLRRFDRALTRGPLQDGALDALLQDTVTTLGASAGSIMLLDQSEGLLHMRAAAGLSDEARQNGRQALGDGIAGFVALHNTPLMIPGGLGQAGDDPRQFVRRMHIHSALSVPIRSARRGMLGVFNLSSYEQEHRFNDDDLSWLASLALRAGKIMSERR